MRIVRDVNRQIPYGMYRGYTVELRSLAAGEKSSLDLRNEIGRITSDAELLAFVASQCNEYIHLDQSRSGFYSALATFLHFRSMEFFGDHRTFVLCHYLPIVLHLFAPAGALREQNIIGLPGQKLLQFHSVLTRIRSNIQSLRPDRLQLRRLIPESSLSWVPFVTEVFRGLEYLSKIYFIKNDQRDAKKTFVEFLGIVSSLEPLLREGLWEFRCGVVHHGTLYNYTSRGVFRFGVQTLSAGQPAIADGNDPDNSYLVGDKFLVNLRGLAELMDAAQRTVYHDMMGHIDKYVLSQAFYTWFGRSWNFQYLPSNNEMGTLVGEPGSKFLHIDNISDVPLSRRGNMAIVEFEDYIWVRYIAEKLPSLFRAWVGLSRWKRHKRK